MLFDDDILIIIYFILFSDKSPKPIPDIFQSKLFVHNGTHIDQPQIEGLEPNSADQSNPSGGYNYTQIIEQVIRIKEFTRKMSFQSVVIDSYSYSSYTIYLHPYW